MQHCFVGSLSLDVQAHGVELLKLGISGMLSFNCVIIFGALQLQVLAWMWQNTQFPNISEAQLHSLGAEAASYLACHAGKSFCAVGAHFYERWLESLWEWKLVICRHGLKRVCMSWETSWASSCRHACRYLVGTALLGVPSSGKYV